MKGKIVPIPIWWNNSIDGDGALNLRGLSWGPGDANVQRLKGEPLFGGFEAL